MPKLSGDNEVQFSEAEVALYKTAYNLKGDLLPTRAYWFEFDFDTSAVLDTNMPESAWSIGYALVADGFRYLCDLDTDSPPDYFVDYDKA